MKSRSAGPCESAVFGCCVPVDAECFGDIGRLLLQSVGAASPSQAAINLAVEANNAFVERLEQIAAEDQGT